MIEIGKGMKVPAGQLIKRWRTNKDMSARALSLACGLSPSYISKMETGNLIPPVNTFMRIAEELKLNQEEILFLLGAFTIEEEKNEG